MGGSRGQSGASVRRSRRGGAASGFDRQRVRIAVLAAILGLSGADIGTVSATATALQHAFGIGNTEIGLLVTVTTAAGAALALPAGIVTDRWRRTTVLAISIACWAVAMGFAGAATSYGWLLIARVALGIVTATAGPGVASLTGDLVPGGSRARVYGVILGGELLGTGAGYVVSVNLAAISWRLAIWWLIVPAVVLVWAVSRIQEPVRGSQDRSQAGADGGSLAHRIALRLHPQADRDRAGADPVAVDPAVVDPARLSTRASIAYILRIRTNVVVIAASALGYFFFAGVRTFAIVFATDWFGVSRQIASLLVLLIGAAAVGGVFCGGRIADRWLAHGFLSARVLIASVCLLLVAPVMGLGFLSASLVLAAPLLAGGGFLLGAVNPPLDAARLDIVPAPLWGRAEGVRTVPRQVGEAIAPTAFGWVSDTAFHGPAALPHTFEVFLITLVVAGLLGLWALRTYPGDVVNAALATHPHKPARSRV